MKDEIKNKKKFIKTDSYNWGNFLSYAYKASNIMVNNKIKQLKLNYFNKKKSPEAEKLPKKSLPFYRN